MLNRGKELLRICPTNAEKLEYSTNDGRSWNARYPSGSGKFSDLTDNGKEILGTTDKGLYYSTNDGRSWNKRH
jgi:hypothetical protein